MHPAHLGDGSTDIQKELASQSHSVNEPAQAERLSPTPSTDSALPAKPSPVSQQISRVALGETLASLPRLSHCKMGEILVPTGRDRPSSEKVNPCNSTAHRTRSESVSVVTVIHSQPSSVVKGHPPPTRTAGLAVDGGLFGTDLHCGNHFGASPLR